MTDLATGSTVRHSTDGTSLFHQVLPATSPEELLTRLAEVISAEAFFVRRKRWPQWLGIRRWSDGPHQVELFDDEDVPSTGRVIGPARLIGGHRELDGTSVRLLVDQIRDLDDQLLDQKLAAMAELAAGAGHEVNNPLGSIIGRATQLLRDEQDPQRQRTLAAIVSQAYRGRDMIGDLMLFARPPSPIPRCEPLSEAIGEVIADFRNDLELRSLEVTGTLDDSISVWADPTQLRIVLSELVRNAIRFAPTNTPVAISTQLYRAGANLTVTHNGPALSERERRHGFDPFFSGREAGRGLGFGLSKCWRILSLHGGSIRLSGEGELSRIALQWPTSPVAMSTS